MQKLSECARRQYIISKNLYGSLLKCSVGKQYDLNRLFRHFYHEIASRRLPAAILRNNHHKVCRDLNFINSVTMRYVFLKACNTQIPPRILGARFFSTTRLLSSSDSGKKQSDEKTDKDEKSDEKNKWPDDMVPPIIHFMIITVLISSMIRALTGQQKDIAEEENMISWSDFYNKMLSKGEVVSVFIYPEFNRARIMVRRDAIIAGKRPTVPVFYMQLPDHKVFEEKIIEAQDKLQIPHNERIPVIYVRPQERTKLIFTAVLLALIFAVGYKAYTQFKPFVGQFKNMMPWTAKFTLVEPTKGKGVHFKDVAGLTEAKVEVAEFVEYLKHPERYRALGAKVPKGALLLGPPGCGKTMLAKAVATESNVPFYAMNGCEFVEMLGGMGASRVRDLFAAAKKSAPSIIYIDEIDAFGKKRESGSYAEGESETERTMVQLLVEMDGMTTRDDVVILGSTNRAEVLDKALIRRGRFDRHILIDLPNRIERTEIFELHLSRLVLEKPPSHYSEYLASLTPGFTGADIANICNEAALYAARHGKQNVQGSDLLYALDRVQRGPLKKSHTMQRDESKVIAYRESAYALLMWLLKHTDPVAKVTMVPSTSGSMGYTRLLKSERFLSNENRLADIACATIGTRVTEQLLFGEGSDATEKYLKDVSDLIYKQVTQFGMSRTIGLISFEPEEYRDPARPFSKKLHAAIDDEVRRIFIETSDRARKILVENLSSLHKLAEALQKKDTLYYEDIVNLIGAPPYGKKKPEYPVSFMESADAKPSIEKTELNKGKDPA